jgi:putative DNA primase/helicase
MTTAISDIREYLDACLGDSQGRLHVATGAGPRLSDAGRYEHTQWAETRFAWPIEADQAAREIFQAATDCDVYVCPYPMCGEKRVKGAAAARRIVHADVDHGHLDLDEVRAINGYAVGSGTPGNGHVYVALTESIPAHWHRALCRGVGAYLGGADAKISANDVLRPPGTLNHKPTVRGGDPAVVEWLVRPSGVRVDPQTLARTLGVALPAAADTAAVNGHASTVDVEAIEIDEYPAVKAALDAVAVPADRSTDTMRVVGACRDAGLTLPQTRYVVGSRADLASRVQGRNDDDVQNCWLKVSRQVRTWAESSGNDPKDVRAVATSSDPTRMHRGQARMAYRLAHRYAGQLLHVTGFGWLRWDGYRWAVDDRGAAKRAVLAELRRALADSLDDKELRADVRRCESSSGVAGVLDLAAALNPFAAAVSDLDADAHLLNVANGTLDLRTLELRRHSPGDRITKVCQGAYRADAESSQWQAFLARVLPHDDVRSFLQRLVGVGLVGAVREHVLPILTGVGANGKSVFDKASRYALGDYAATAEPDLFMHRAGAHPTGEMDLRGVRWVAVSESDKDRRLAEATMKRLTGGDTVRARRMRQDFVEFTPSHTPLLITNHLPKVSGDDAAVWRRLRVVPFDVVIPEDEQNRDLDARLQLEADGILAWAVTGYRDYLARGLDEPATVLEATDTYHHNSDAVARFIAEECMTSSPVLKATTGQLHDAWEQWRVLDGAEPMSRKAFGQALDRHGYSAEPPVNGKRWRPGIALKVVQDDAD